MNPYMIIGAGVVALVLCVSAFAAGHHVAAQAAQVKLDGMIAAADEATQKQRQAEIIQASNASAGFQHDNAKAQIVYRTITEEVEKIVDRPVYTGQCFDADGLRLANLALAGVPADANPSGPNPTVPGPDAAP